MSIPRITLWTAPYRMTLRLAEKLPFKGRLRGDPYLPQTNQIQHNANVTLEITPGAMYILSAIAGRRIAEPVRWVLLDSLSDVIEGELRTEQPEQQDLLASTFGELVGALCFALRLGGEVELVRVIEGSAGKSPDFFLIQHTDGKQRYHLLECKGTMQDLHNIKSRPKLDLCQTIRRHRNEAHEQLKYVTDNKVSLIAGARLSARPKRRKAKAKKPFAPNRFVASRNAAVTCVPDGRLAVFRPIVTSPRHPGCRGVTCLECLSVPGSAQPRNNPIVAIFEEPLNIAADLFQNNFGRFIRSYREADRALWSGNDQALNQAAEAMLEQRQGENDGELRETQALITANVLEEAVAQDLIIGDQIAVRLAELESEDRSELVKRVISGNDERKRVLRQNLQPVAPEVAIDRIQSSQGPRRMKLLIETLQGPIDIKLSSTVIQGTVRNYDGAALIRLTTDVTEPGSYEALRVQAEKIINQLRRNVREKEIAWQDEYAALGASRIVLGQSWDAFPYPHDGLGRPGITAWISYEGRAEIIVRFPRPVVARDIPPSESLQV